MADKPFIEMTLDELRAERDKWQAKIDAATGWGAAYAQYINWRGQCDRFIARLDSRTHDEFPEVK